MKLYFPRSHYNPSYRGLVLPLLKPFIKSEDFTDTQRIEMYGLSESDFEFTDKIEDANLAILTMAWNYYLKTEQKELAIDFINKCNELGIKVLTVNVGDFGVRVPHFKNVVAVRSSGYKSKFSKNEYALPPFIKDPLIAYFNRNTIAERMYSAKPVIGFCGQANISRINATKEIFNTGLRNFRFYLGMSPQEPQELISTSFLRASILSLLKKSSNNHSNFIIRKKYRAGVIANKEKHKTTKEFHQNLMNSDYIVCARGAGNFSIRFYETLAMGRIPIFINTDSPLPFDDDIDWKKHVVWVEYKDRKKVAEKLTEFHQALSKKDFIALQNSNRNLWKERLTLNGFFKNYFSYILR